MRTVPLVLAALALAAPVAASAYCFSIYDEQNRLTYQSQVPPIDLSLTISQGMAQRYPGKHLVMATDATQCSEFDGSSPDISRLSGARESSSNALVRILQQPSGGNVSGTDDYIGGTPVSRATGSRVPPRGAGTRR